MIFLRALFLARPNHQLVRYIDSAPVAHIQAEMARDAGRRFALSFDGGDDGPLAVAHHQRNLRGLHHLEAEHLFIKAPGRNQIVAFDSAVGQIVGFEEWFDFFSAGP